MIVRKSTSVRDICRSIHRDFELQFKHALVWGKSAKHIPQRVGLGHVMEDEDVIQIIKKCVPIESLSNLSFVYC